MVETGHHDAPKSRGIGACDEGCQRTEEEKFCAGLLHRELIAAAQLLLRVECEFAAGAVTARHSRPIESKIAQLASIVDANAVFVPRRASRQTRPLINAYPALFRKKLGQLVDAENNVQILQKGKRAQYVFPGSQLVTCK